jgi:hypothetical protein
VPVAVVVIGHGLLRYAVLTLTRGPCHPLPQAASNFFELNASSFDRTHLAMALRGVLVSGPTKQTPVPFLVGPTNTGKSTLVEPFDDLFGSSAPCYPSAVAAVIVIRTRPALRCAMSTPATSMFMLPRPSVSQ